MRPVSPVQFTAFERGATPPVEEVRDGVWSVPNPMPAPAKPLAATLCYLIEDARGALHLIDAGIDHDPGFAAVEGAIARAGHSLGDLATIVVTHLHLDHIGMAPRLRDASGARIILHAREQWAIDHAAELRARLDTQTLADWGVPDSRRSELLAVPLDSAQPPSPIRAEQVVRAGDDLPVAGRHLRVIDSPGHTPGSMSIVDDDERLLFTGDALLPTVYPGIGLGGATPDPVGDYVRSLEALREYDDYEACPGHEFRFAQVAERCDTTREHQLRRSREVAAAIAADPNATVWQLASRLHWTLGFDGLHGFQLYSALAQTVMHREFVRSADHEPPARGDQ